MADIEPTEIVQPQEPARRQSDIPTPAKEEAQSPIQFKPTLELLLNESKEASEPEQDTNESQHEDKDKVIEEQQVEIDRLQSLVEKLATEAKIDTQTGLFNKNEFINQLYPAFIQSFRNGTPLGMLSLDLQGLKKINDTEGHDAGDELIAKLGATIKRVIGDRMRSTDMAFRVGGDEFIILLPGADIEGVRAAGASYKELFDQEGIHTGLGGGVADVTDWNTMQASVRGVDQALYDSKSQNYETGENNLKLAA